MHIDQLATHAARNIIVPVDDLAEGIGLSEDDFTPEIWDAGNYNDERYGIPLDVHSLARYHNTDHFEQAGIPEPPTDEASFMEALDKLKAAAGFETPSWMPSLWPSHLIYLSPMGQQGVESYGQDGTEAAYDSETGVAALEWQRSIVDQGYSPPGVAVDPQYTALENCETSITRDGIWEINDLESNNIAYGIAPLPAILDEQGQWANSHHFFISTQGAEDENKAAPAQVLIARLSEHSADWAGSAKIPARLSERDAAADFPQPPSPR